MSKIVNPSTSDNVEEILKLHERVNQALKRSLDDAIRIGQLLSEEKEERGYGRFGSWVKRNFPFTSRAASSYMRMYDNREALLTSGVTSITAAKLLLSPKKPPKPKSQPVGVIDTEGKDVTCSENELVQEAPSEESAYKVARTEDTSPQSGQKGDFDDLDQELLEMAEEKSSSDDELFDTSDGIFNGTTSEGVKVDPSATVEDVIKSSGVKPANWKEPPAPKEDLLDSGDLALVAEAVSHCRDMWVRRVLEKIGKHSDPMVRGMAEVGLERHENLLSSPEPEKDKRREALPELWLDTLYEMALCEEDERVLGVLKRILGKLHE